MNDIVDCLSVISILLEHKLTHNELFLGYLAGIDDTDRHGNTDIFAYNKRMNGRNTDILIKESGNKRSGSIEYQLVIMKHTAHYIESVLR